jgi:hypothetical protein
VATYILLIAKESANGYPTETHIIAANNAKNMAKIANEDRDIFG